jgi:hypothetical protein
MLGEELGHEGGVTNIAVGEDVTRVGREVGEVGGIAGVSEGVEVDEFRERRALFEETLTDKVGADKAGAAGDEEVHGLNGFSRFDAVDAHFAHGVVEPIMDHEIISDPYSDFSVVGVGISKMTIAKRVGGELV